VWTPHRLPAGLPDYVIGLPGVDASVVVGNGTVWLPGGQSTPHGMAVPIDVSAVDVRQYTAVISQATPPFARLRPGTAVLSRDSARLRRVHVGDTIAFPDNQLRVAAVVPDQLIGDAEMMVTAADGRRLGVAPDRYLLVLPATTDRWPRIERAIRRWLPAGTRVRIRAPGTARWLREGDAVLPPLLEKLRYGEFAANPRATSDGYLTIDQHWRARHLETAAVPILGHVTCNRAFIPSLRAALRRVVQQGLAHLINPADYGGCWAPRLIPGAPGDSISHHAYGSAIDINVSANPQGSRPHQDPRLVRIFASFGLTWGGRWLVQDGMHFEGLGR
jgi:hypothetical protein